MAQQFLAWAFKSTKGKIYIEKKPCTQMLVAF